MIQIARLESPSGATSIHLEPPSGDELERLRAAFENEHWLKIPALLEPSLFDEIAARVEAADYGPRRHEGIGSEAVMRADTVYGLLFFLCNDPRLFTLVEGVTGCERIGCFEGRVYRMEAAAGHYDSWHDDLTDHRMIAMSLNLGRVPHAGGILQIRDRASGDVIQQVENTGPGDALLFRLRADLQHRVTAVEGTRPRTAFAGWFKSEPDFLSVLATRKWKER